MKKKNPSITNRAIKYRLYPSKDQKIYFTRTFGCCRKIWNLMLADKIKSYRKTGKFISVTPAKYKEEYPFLKEVDSLALANKQLDLQQAFINCFSRSRKKRNNFPKFKSAKHDRRSYTTNNQSGTVEITDKSIKLPKIGFVKAVVHRKPSKEWNIKSVTVSLESDDRYYASVLFEFIKPENNYVADINNAIALDYASDGLFADSEGRIGSEHKYYRESQKKLAKAQQKLSRKKGSKKNEIKSNNYLKQLLKVNRIHRHIANQRKDNLHKLSTEIANQYDTVCAEDLDMKSLSNKGFGNGKATMDNGYGMFLSMLEYKLSERNKYLVKIDKWYPSSQICSNCGSIHPEMKELKNRIMKCECGFVKDRDINAAINILNEGLRILKAA